MEYSRRSTNVSHMPAAWRATPKCTGILMASGHSPVLTREGLDALIVASGVAGYGVCRVFMTGAYVNR